MKSNANISTTRILRLNGALFVTSLLLLGAGESATAATPASTTNSLPPSDVGAWNIIPKRNIFNSRRSPQYVPTQRESRSAPAPRVESFALVGTMDYDKGPIAFFDGSRSEFRKVLKPDETIGGMKIVEVAPKYVKLAGATNTIELRLGMQLRRENNGEWTMSERPESMEPLPAPASMAHVSYQTNTPATNSYGSITDLLNGLANGELPNFPPPDGAAFGAGGPPPGFGSQPSQTAQPGTAQAPGSAPTAGGSDSDVLQRLLRRRQQENQ